MSLTPHIYTARCRCGWHWHAMDREAVYKHAHRHADEHGHDVEIAWVDSVVIAGGPREGSA